MRRPIHLWLLLILLIPGEYLYTRYMSQKIFLGKILVCIDDLEMEEKCQKLLVME